MRKLELDAETADRITILSIQDHRKYLKKELKDYRKGEWLHSEDVANNIKLIDAMNLILKYYGAD